MKEHLIAISSYDTLSPAQKSRLNTDALEKQYIIEDAYASISQNPRQFLRFLADAAKKQRTREHLSELERAGSRIAEQLSSNDAKTRKNAAIALGALKDKRFSHLIIDALKREDTEFVIPSLILALGECGGETAKKFIFSYHVRCTVAKHLEAETEAIKKCVSSLNDSPASVSPVVNGDNIILTAVREHDYLLEEELAENEFEFKSFLKMPCAFSLKVQKFEDIYKIRTFTESFILLGAFSSLQAAIDALNTEKIVNKIYMIYQNGMLNYRLSIFSTKLSKEEKTRRVLEASNALDRRDRFLNSPSNYFFELRVSETSDGALLLLKPYTLDHRFDYRKNTLPASIHPTTAAAILRYCYPYLKHDARVIDPFCGTGTMVVERAFIKRYASLSLSDISSNAVTLAKENVRAAGLKAKIFMHDAAKPFDASYDEVLSNMPFGLRVGSHENNESLYASFAINLERTLSDGGMAFLLTNDKLTFTHALAKTCLKQVDEAVFDSGSLKPSLFIYKK